MLFKIRLAVLLGLVWLLQSCGGADTSEKATQLTLTLSSEVLDAGFPQQFSYVTATVRDQDNKLLLNAQVEFSTTLGSFSPTAPLLSTQVPTDRGEASGRGEGQAIVKLYPGAVAGAAKVTAYVNGVQQTATVTIAGQAPLPVDPVVSQLQLKVANPALVVTGTGGQDSTNIQIQLFNRAGLPAGDGPAGVDNLLVQLTSRPNGGEVLQGQQASGALVRDSQQVRLKSRNGVATLQLQAGTLPGVLELSVEALNEQGLPLSPAVKTSLSGLSIASGPAHSIAVSYPRLDSLTNLGNGLYRRKGGLLVTDRHGNAVPNGTVVSLGALDSVLLSNMAPALHYGAFQSVAAGDASAQQAGLLLTDPSNALFKSAYNLRNNFNRYIQQGDRVLLPNAQAGDKIRFVAADPVENQQLTLNKAWSQSYNQLQYLVGAALVGVQIAGEAATGSTDLVPGQAIVKDGYATFYLTYPANPQTLRLGCLSDPQQDSRYLPLGSAQVWVVAEVNGTAATTLDRQACFAGLLPFTLSADTTQLSGSAKVLLKAQDASLISLPFTDLTVTVSYDKNDGGLQVTPAAACAGQTGLRTDQRGECLLPLTVTGGVSADQAKVKIQLSDSGSQVELTVTKA